jgi:hypothetical protein
MAGAHGADHAVSRTEPLEVDAAQIGIWGSIPLTEYFPFRVRTPIGCPAALLCSSISSEQARPVPGLRSRSASGISKYRSHDYQYRKSIP